MKWSFRIEVVMKKMMGERNRLIIFTSLSEGFENPRIGMYSIIFQASR